MPSPVPVPTGIRFVEGSKEFGPKWYASDIVTPIGILDYFHLYQPDQKGRTPFSRNEYDARLLFSKTDPKFQNLVKPFQMIKSLAFADMVNVAGWKCKSPVRDGDALPRAARPGHPEPRKLPDYYKGMYYITCRAPAAEAAVGNQKARNGRPPKMVGRDGKPPKDIPESEGLALFYRGARVRFMITAHNYTMKADDPGEPDKDGITFKLDLVQWVGHGTPLGGANVNALDELPGEDGEDMGGPDPLDNPAGTQVGAGPAGRSTAYDSAQAARRSIGTPVEVDPMG